MSDLRVEIMRAHQDVANAVPGAENRLKSLQAKYRTSGAMIARTGGTCHLIEPGSASSSPQRVSRPAIERDHLLFGHPSSKVVIRSRSTEPTQFTVTLSSGARREIEDELSLVRRELGSDFECGGWLYGQYRPRESSDSLTIAFATHAGDSEHGRSSITIGESATSLMLRSFPPELAHMKYLGDWHSHRLGGGTIPSEADARGWAQSLDKYGFARYTAIIVSPSESMGWMNPILTAWTVRREGAPSVPICEPARLVG